MHLNDQKEQFSLAYIHAVAACAGYQLEIPDSPDRHSVDGRLFSDAEIIEVQAKATSQDIERDGIVRFPLPVKNHDDLRNPDAMALRLLVVVQLPDDPGAWLDQTQDQLCLAGRGVWRILRGEPATQNADSVTVQIPTSNRFDRDGLIGLMRRARERQW